MNSHGTIAMIAALTACAPTGRQPTGAHADPAPAAAERPFGDSAARCRLEVRFGSYAMGIDGGTLRRVEQLLAEDTAVISVTRTPWGREGELTICAAVHGPADAERLARAIAALVPGNPRGPIAVRTASGLVFSAGR